MYVSVTLEEGGKYWRILIKQDELMALLNTGRYNGQKIYSVSCHIEHVEMLYDFVLKQWR